MSEVKYLGHVIDGDGHHWTGEQLQEVEEFALSATVHQMRGFIGLCEYFHDHVQNLAVLLEPLRELIPGGAVSKRESKNVQLQWTEEALAAFDSVKQAMVNCPRLFFLDQAAPVYLHTDASDYGIGAYLFQLRRQENPDRPGEFREVECPIRFMSKKLSKTQFRWSTHEKECYAIYYALHKFKTLLGSVKFTLRTDHRNLTFLDSAPGSSSVVSNKVKRWKIFIIEFDFDVEHIAGEQNVVADGLSRFIPDTCVAEARAEIVSALRLARESPTEQARQSRRLAFLRSCSRCFTRHIVIPQGILACWKR